MAVPMQNGPVVSAPMYDFYPAATPMVNHFQKRPQISNAGALEYSYDTFGAPLIDLVGAGTGFKRSPLAPGREPMVANPTVFRGGLAMPAGQYMLSPLSAAVE